MAEGAIEARGLYTIYTETTILASLYTETLLKEKKKLTNFILLGKFCKDEQLPNSNT